MSNAAYAKVLIANLKQIPKRLAERAVMGAFESALNSTYQDSGNAAFNWYLTSVGGTRFMRAQGLQDLRGSGHPVVGTRGEDRGFGHERVVTFKVNEVHHRVRTALYQKGDTRLRLATMIPEGAYAKAADLKEALAAAEVGAQRAADLYMAKFNRYSGQSWGA